MRIIGLTGSIACGKSTVSQVIKDQGYPVIDGDVLSRECTGPNGPALPSIRQLWGNAVFDSSGQLNRRALGKIVFSDPAALQQLNRLMAPHLRELTEQYLNEARASGAKLCFLEMPLLFEQGYDALCDSVWCVWLPEKLQLSRLMARDHLTEAEAQQRISSVLSSDEKAARSSFVLDNSSSPEDLLRQIPEILEKELALASYRRRRSAQYAPAQNSRVSSENVSCASASVNSQSPAVTIPDSSADGVERPSSYQRKPSVRKTAWRLPSWLMILLIAFSAVLAVSFTAQCLMSAYLTQQHAKHQDEQQAVDERYPLMYKDLIVQYASLYNLRPAYVSAIIRNESSFRADAESSVGARGLMQLMPDTAEWIAHKLKLEGYAFERMYDPESNIRFGCWYLNYLSSLFRGDPVSVTCAYHAGQGEITSWLSDSRYSDDGQTLIIGNLPDGPTKQYAGRVTRDDGIYQEKYFSPASFSDGSLGISEP